VAQEIGHLPSNREALNSSPRTTKKGGKNQILFLALFQILFWEYIFIENELSVNSNGVVAHFCNPSIRRWG
jgi:hypothetical protein